MDQALFWTFELYYSGFEEDTLDYLLGIYESIYKSLHPSLYKYIETMILKWRTDNDCCAYGNIVATLSTRTYDLYDFCKTYLYIDGKQQPSSKLRFIVSLRETDIEKYKNDISTEHIYRILQKQCKYQTRNEFNKIFNTNLPEHAVLFKLYNYRWLYYAYRSPLWKTRIDKYNGIVNVNNCKVIFDDDDDIENFHKLWGYEPDEQTYATRHNCIGLPNIPYINIKDFCKKFGFHMKIIKKMKSTENTSIN
jgi:hypothetical protein